MIRERYRVKDNMLPLSVMEECLTGLRPYRHSLSPTYHYLLYDKKVFYKKNNYFFFETHSHILLV